MTEGWQPPSDESDKQTIRYTPMDKPLQPHGPSPTINAGGPPPGDGGLETIPASGQSLIAGGPETLNASAAYPYLTPMATQHEAAELASPTSLETMRQAPTSPPHDEHRTSIPEQFALTPTPYGAHTPGSNLGPSNPPIEMSGVVVEPGNVVFGRYLVIKQLGVGGMGSVWLVRDQELDIERALKLIGNGVGFDAEAFARFRREARIMAKITHAHAVAVQDFRLDLNNVAYIVMEYVQGKSLEKVVKRGHPMPLDWIGRVLVQLCDVLQVAHENGIVHRDLKPSNLMLLDGRAPGREHLKVLDFGIAKVLGAEEHANDAHTVAGAFMGTPPYTSPEQADGIADPRGDLYSVGIILYEMMTGYRPFSGPLMSLIADTMRTPPPRFADINPKVEIPPAIEAIVQRCLAKTPEERPQSARQLSDEFQAAMQELGLQATLPAGAPLPTSKPIEPEIKPVRPRKPLAAMIVGGVVLPLVALGIVVANRNGANTGKTETVTSPTVVTPGTTPIVVVPPKDTTKAKPRSRLDGFVPAGKVYLPDGYAIDEESGNELVDGRWPKIIKRTDGVRFIRIPAATFKMGSTGGEDTSESNQPPHEVTLSGFYIQELEVTNAEMLAFTKANNPFDAAMAARWKTRVDEIKAFPKAIDEIVSKQPAANVPWRLAQDFAIAKGGDLPTEAQWEWAARAGADGKDSGPLIWSTKQAAAVAVNQLSNLDYGAPTDWGTTDGFGFPFDRTGRGVRNLAGNVREWCRDVFTPYASMSSQSKDPEFPPDKLAAKPSMVVRGGSFKTSIDLRFTTARGNPVEMTSALIDLGFRVVLECPDDVPPEK